jgi:hypothetical protein
MVVDLGLDVWWAGVVAWMQVQLQGPYDLWLITMYVIGLLMGIVGRFFGVLFMGLTVVWLFFAMIVMGVQIAGAMLGAFWSAISNPCAVASLPVPEPLVKAYLLVDQILNQIESISLIQDVLIGALSLAVLFWTVSQFKNLTGGGE